MKKYSIQSALFWITNQINKWWRLFCFIILLLAGTLTIGIDSQNTSKKYNSLFIADNVSGKPQTKFQTVLDSMQQRFGFPGATAAYVWVDGRKGTAATGMADAEAGLPMTTDSRILAASIGKMFVGAAAVSLIHDGVLALDNPVSTWLGGRDWFTRLPNHENITLRHLLTHRSGLPNHVYMDEFAAEVKQRMADQTLPISPDSLVMFVLDQDPLFEVDEGWAYTDTGYILVGLIIEEATGRDIYSIIEEQFLAPLNLHSTSPSNRYYLPGLAAGYAAENSLGFPLKTTTAEGRMVWHPGIEWTGGGFDQHICRFSQLGSQVVWRGRTARSSSRPASGYTARRSNSDNIQYGMGVAAYKGGALERCTVIAAGFPATHPASGTIKSTV